MTDDSQSNRRDFLRGKSAVDAARAKLASSATDTLENPQFARSKDRQSNYLEQYSKNAMACEFELLFNLHQYKNSGPAAMDAFQLIDHIEDQMSVYRDHSEVSQINQSAYEEDFTVEPRLFDLLLLAEEISKSTLGAFDITSGPLSRVWGFSNRAGELPDKASIAKALNLVDMGLVKLNRNHNTIRFLKPDLTFNLNGIGKGHSLDRVAEQFADRGVGDFIIHGGQSSVLARGSSNPQEASNDDPETISLSAGWAVGLTHPTTPGVRLGEYVLRNQALGTSGTARQGFYHQGKRYGHIIDPRTGWPSDYHLSTTVVSKSGAISDALATAFFVMKDEEIQTYCDNNKTVSAIVCNSRKKGKGALEILTFNLSENDLKLGI